MLKSSTWPGNVAVEPLRDMDSAGSCDSVISMNSGCSDDSMEHLTPEERACLMFLEETIEALEVQEDSGLSNDEPEFWTKAEDQIRVNGISSLASQSKSQGMPPPLAPTAVDPAPTTEHHPLNQKPELQSSPAPGSTSPSAVNPTEVPGLTMNGARDPEGVTSTRSFPEEETPENDLSILPPPSDFMDELDTGSQPKKSNDVPAPSEFSTEPEPRVESGQLNSTDSVNKLSSLTEDPSVNPPPDAASVPLINTPPEFSPPKSPPPVAPKPKRLPARIALQSQKTAVGSSDGSLRLSVPTGSDRVVVDQQKAHMEALQKLGLLKENEETGLGKSSKLPPKTRQSWAGPSPTSPAVSYTPPLTPSYTFLSSPPPASPLLQCGTPAAVLPVSTAPPAQEPDILPAPAAFCDPIQPLPSINNPPAGADVTDGAVSTPALTPPLTPPAPVRQLTSPKVMDMKSATLEHSGVGLSSYLIGLNPTKADQRPIGEQSLSSRLRPASLGSTKDLSCARGEDMPTAPATSKQPDSQRPQHAHDVFQHARESSKLPRSQGISVLFCPRPENEEERREALKKLGLLRD
ncbi:specifically androgen-regulated gene protein [Kryptolebias marmoratus]|uniref:Specifically androgen-regulated gene protein-like n=1 Tax=Kryptolebias marmoratus TaxID=37003 RepID=A0A3Q3ADT1_KRYMA|nr:specifically androgen-regulated gene protein [Kryptolebias marmoratus]